MTFILTYNYGFLRDKKMRVRNCNSEDDAKYRLHGYLIRKHGRKNLEIVECVLEEENPLDIFGGIFRDIFK